MKQHLFGKVFIICILMISVLNICAPKQAQSLRENRVLAKVPTLSLSSLSQGSFQRDYASYVNDQFFQRDAMREVKNTLETALQIRKIDDVYIGSNNELIQAQVQIEQTQIEVIGNLMNDFANAHEDVQMTSIIVPNKGTINQADIPKNAPIDDQSDELKHLQNTLTSFQTIDALTILRAQEEAALYYKSDHHWTTLGAYTIANSFLEAQGNKDKIAYNPVLVNDHFYGTLANTTGLDIYDELYIYEAIDDSTKAIVNYVEEQKKTTSVYDLEKQYSPNPYDVFLGGNHPLVEITTTSTQAGSLLIIKDSYANCFIPFLLPYYHRISVVDPRYYYESLSQLMRLQGVDEVLFLYNANTFFNDTSLQDVLREERSK